MLPLLAARAGAGHVTAVERGQSLYRMARQALRGNPMWADAIQLLDRPLGQVTVQGEPPRALPASRSGPSQAA